MATTKQAYAQEGFGVGMAQYTHGQQVEFPYETDVEKQQVDALFEAGLLADTEPGPDPYAVVKEAEYSDVPFAELDKASKKASKKKS